jgi:hypothetical protein
MPILKTSRPSFATLCAAWCALVAISVVGRLWQPIPNVTPLAGAAIVSGAVFPSALVAASVPVAALVLSNLVLPGYGGGMAGWAMLALVCACLTWPVLLGRLVRGGRSWSAGASVGGLPAGTLVGSGLASSLVFFLVTNAAHWWLSTDYPHTAAGLLACYAAGLPFYRWMPVGDVVWTLVLARGMAALGASAAAAPSISANPVQAA